MRETFAQRLLELALSDSRIFLIVGDLGFGLFDEFARQIPSRFVNAGVSEANMTGVAAGMALEGKIPVIYSIVPFVTMRNLEQLRNDICYQNLNVKIVGIGAGFSYGPYGFTHQGIEDISIVRTLPYIKIYSPGDAVETKFAVEEMLKSKSPVYLRLGRVSNFRRVHKSRRVLKSGKGVVIKKSNNCMLIGGGTMLNYCLDVLDNLKEKGIDAGLVSMHTIKPIDKALIESLIDTTKAIFTVEEHSLTGGLGSAVSEILAESKKNVIFKRLGIGNYIENAVGDYEYMKDLYGLSVKKITKTILKFFKT